MKSPTGRRGSAAGRDSEMIEKFVKPPGPPGKLTRKGTMAKMKLSAPPKGEAAQKQPQKIKGARPVATYRSCPALGLGSSIPSFLRTTATVIVTNLPEKEILNLVHRYWTARQDGIRFQAPNSYDSSPATFWRVVRQDTGSDETAFQYAYSAMFVLEQMAKENKDVNLLYHCILEEVDENTYHVHQANPIQSLLLHPYIPTLLSL